MVGFRWKNVLSRSVLWSPNSFFHSLFNLGSGRKKPLVFSAFLYGIASNMFNSLVEEILCMGFPIAEDYVFLIKIRKR